MQNELARETTTPHRHAQPPCTRERGGCSASEGSTLNSTRPPSTRPPETPCDDPNSPTQEETAAPSAGRSQIAKAPPTASSKGEGKDEQLSEVGYLGPTTLREASPHAGTSGSDMAANDPEGGGVMSGSPVTVAKLHLALESLVRPGAGRLDSSKCAQFCTEWPKGCQLPTFFDRTLLEPAWSVAAQVTLRTQSTAVRLCILRGANQYVLL